MSETAVLVVKILAACSCTVMILSPSILISRIVKQKDVGAASVIPLVTLFANCHVWALYGYLTKDWVPIFWIYFPGEAVAIVFLALYWKFTTERRDVTRVLLVTVALLALVSIYAGIGSLGYTNQSQKQVDAIIGVFADISAMCMYASPMEKLLQVLKYKSAAFLNSHMVIAGLTNNCLWCAYGTLTGNWFIIAPSIIFVSLNTFTLILCVVFNAKTHPLPADFHIQRRMSDVPSAPAAEASSKMSAVSYKADSTFPSPAFEALHSPLTSIHVTKGLS
uniref:Bidirectional sugar transporter SWEET n=1 Tax=Peronospora matthiolae TaxID=2874970 RepID=A0AAV1TB38_9STRA